MSQGDTVHSKVFAPQDDILHGDGSIPKDVEEFVSQGDALNGDKSIPKDAEESVSQGDAINGGQPVTQDYVDIGLVTQNVLNSLSKASSAPQCTLTLWEVLGKQFQDYKQSCPFLMIPQQRKFLFDLLPLFLQAYEQTASVLSLPDIRLMASDLGTLLAVEMRKRISNKPAGAARISLTNFLKGAEEGMSGFLLLKSVYILTQTDQELLSCLTRTGLPDVFLQSLYLFLAFPSGKGEIKDNKEELDNLVQDLFLQTMLNLCKQVQGVEELTRSSDFDCLLKAAASGWDRCDIDWTSAVEKVLKDVSKTLSPGVVHHLQTSRCIHRFLQTLSQQFNALPPFVLCQVTNILLSFLLHSYSISPSLLQDFENSQGYPLLLKILRRCEDDTMATDGREQHLDEMISLLSSLVVCGKSEVKVSGQVSHPQLPGFSLGRTTASGRTVKNLQAFQVMQNAFQNSTNSRLCCKILTAMQSIWALEHCNFFLLEWSLQPISQFVEILPLKPPPVHLQFFQLIQFVISDLSFIPHQTLHKIQEMIKQNQCPTCTLGALRLMQNIIPLNSLFSDLFRDSGLLGMLLTQLRNHAKILRRAAGSTPPTLDGDCERELTIGRLQTVCALLHASVRNVVIIKDYGMIPYIKIFLDDMGFRRGALCIMEHLLDIDPDEYMSTVMGALCSSTQSEVTLKLDLLQSLQSMLRSHREKTCFRNAAGFDVLLSLFSDMEGSLRHPPIACWADVQPGHILRLIHATLSAMAAALSLDITNQLFVKSHAVFQKMAEDLLHLGCFLPSDAKHVQCDKAPPSTRTLNELLRWIVSTQSTCSQSLKSCSIIFCLLLGMATRTLSQDGYHHGIKEIIVELPMRECKGTYEVHEESEDGLQEIIEDLFPKGPARCPEDEILTIEPGALCVIITLVQNVYSAEDPKISKELQCAVVEHIVTLSRSERQRQLLCESQLLSCIVRFCKETLRDHKDPLRLPLVRLFEKLASQAVHPDVLRQFLCSGITLQHCSERKANAESSESPQSLLLASSSILHTSVSLVSMTSPRRFQMNTESVSPSFVEFDMSSHGYGCLFLPTIATVLGSNVEEKLTGGIGSGGRNFPFPGGLTFTCWFMLSTFCVSPEPHPVRFVTIVRRVSRSPQHYVCFSITLNAAEHTLLVSTEEQEFQPLDMMEVELSPCSSPSPTSQVRLNTSGHIVTGQWHHLSVVLKEVKKSCMVKAWIDGQLLGSAEIPYIQRLPGDCTSVDPFSLVDIHAFLGTPRIWRQHSSLLWRVGLSHLFEEVLSEETLLLIQRLGPSYCGNYGDGTISPFPSEEKIVFGVTVLSSCFSNVTEIRGTYGDVDGRHIAKELGLSSKDNCTPIFLAKNLACHLSGAARTIGAVTLQSDGVRIFHSSPAADTLNFIGGPAVMLSLVSMATDDQALYAAIKALVSVLSSSLLAEQLMQHIDGYRLFAYLLRRKSYLINRRTFQLLLTIAGTADLGVGPTRPLNLATLQHILCDFQLWLETPGDLDLSLFAHLEEFLRCHRDTEIPQEVQLVPRLVLLLNDPRVTQEKTVLICNLISHCLAYFFSKNDIARLGLFMVSTLPASALDEKQLTPQETWSEDNGSASGRMIWIRNQLLHVLIDLMCAPNSCLPEQQQVEMLVTLGTDWFLLFVHPSVHPTSLVLGIRLVGHLLQNQTLLIRFKDVVRAGALVESNTSDVHILMDNLRSQPVISVCSFPPVSGFSVLLETICHLTHMPQVYIFLSTLLLRSLQGEETLEGDLNIKLQDLLQGHSSKQILQDGLCTEAALLLLTLVKAAVYQKADKPGVLKLADGVMQFLCLIYHSYQHDPLWINTDFIHCLASLLFQTGAQESCKSNGKTTHTGTEDLQRETELHIQSAMKPVQELLHLILRQSLTQLSAVKQGHPLEYLLEVFPADDSIEQKNLFQTEILQWTMEMFHAISRKREQQGISESSPDTEILDVTAIGNLTYFSQKLLDRLYCGVYMADPCDILLFFIKQITAVTYTAAPCNRESLFSMLYGCLNRSILHCLSRSRQTLPGIICLLRVLNLLVTHWDVIFTTYNSSLSFVTCLMHCLIQIHSTSYPEGFGINTKSQRSSWQLIFLSKSEEDEEPITEGPAVQEVYVQVLKVVQTVWENLMVHRRQVLEEHYKMDLSINQGERQISEATPLWVETTSKAWQQHLATEKKHLKTKGRLQTGAGHRITAAVRGLYGGNEQEAECTTQDTASLLDMCKRHGQNIFQCLYNDHQQMQQCRFMAACRDWSALEEELISEAGVWGPLYTTKKQRWQLSPYEGPWRIRKRMQPIQRKLEIMKPAGEGDDASLQRVTTQVGFMKLNTGRDEGTELTFFPTLLESIQCTSSSEACPEKLSILQEFPEGERISGKMSIVLVEGHMISEGVLLFGRNNFYLCSDYTLSTFGEVLCSKHGLSSIQDSFIYDLCHKSSENIQEAKEVEKPTDGDSPSSPGRVTESAIPLAERFAYEEVLKLQPMRFLMQENALEIFFTNTISKFVVFPNKDVSTAVKWFHSLMPCTKIKTTGEDSQHMRSFAGEKAMLQKWQRREVGNYEYLMFLNSLSGRTIKDLMQYPVLPWVLRDYVSQTLDLSNPKVFRDLSKPMGAQTKERRQKFIQRYQEVEKSEGDLSEQCHYCTHYSSASIVSSYLVRVEPFTKAMRCLQGGSLDLADRMFHSVKGAWESASRDNMSDVRELIPEFFYLHEMFSNGNHCQLGCMQDGTVLGDVILPPWAQRDPQTFIRLHREALESEHVSSQLHHWIDLVFGYKQRGATAIQALNVFHPYFYGFPEHLSSSDPLIRSTLIGFISSFGQVPKQLFTKPHPPRLGKESVGGHYVTPFYSSPSSLKYATITPRAGALRGAVGQMLLTDKGLIAVEKNQILLPPNYSTSLSWGHNDGSLRLHNRSTRKVVAVWEFMSQWGWCHSVVHSSPSLIITAMSSSVLCVWEISPPAHREHEYALQFKKVLTGHGSAVLCIFASVQYGVLISGSADGSCIIWDLDKLYCVRRLPPHPGEVTCVVISDSTGSAASCCRSVLYVWTVSGDPISCVDTGCEILSCCFAGLSMIITGSDDGTVKFWKMDRAGPQEEIGLGGEKLGTSLHMFHQLSTNVPATGKQLPAPVTALTVSRNFSKLFVGDERGVITSWYLDG
ncbi:WD repeat- and FYVE domain-containing protein 4 isoform X2 [Bombina bombina]|uniref:WD repeat- and FYVE domain-containing protein 4 isoform X2 n=1 Tax=Bombina bombina TaxID=8345 RepID=UPI00235A6141|nr:WD repeat- and FYVE domain-containing protein 4 isoform X2 [Bombina bombina]